VKIQSDNYSIQMADYHFCDVDSRIVSSKFPKSKNVVSKRLNSLYSITAFCQVIIQLPM